MQCVTCQGAKIDEDGNKCDDCHGTGYNLPTGEKLAEAVTALLARQSKFYQERENEPWDSALYGEEEEE